MKTKTVWRCFRILIAMILLLGMGETLLGPLTVKSDEPPTAGGEPVIGVTIPAWAQQSGTGDVPLAAPPPGSVFSAQPGSGPDPNTLSGAGVNAASNVIGVFTNTWSYSTIGLVYDPGRDQVRYAHESQSSTHNPTIYDVDTLSHTVLYSVALSAQNSGCNWPWQIDNRDGAGYDFINDTYFLPDYNGDLSYSDDNIV